jgi:hypothetical protein
MINVTRKLYGGHNATAVNRVGQQASEAKYLPPSLLLILSQNSQCMDAKEGWNTRMMRDAAERIQKEQLIDCRGRCQLGL